MHGLSCLPILLLFSLSVCAQQQTRQAQPDPTPDPQRQHAISMIEQSAAEATLWDDRNVAVEVLADAADLLWDHTPDQASKWLTKAWALIGQTPDTPRNDKLKVFFTDSQRAGLQTIVLRVAAKHDTRLSEKFLKELTENEPPKKREQGAFDDRTARAQQLLHLAQQLIDVNPQQAFSLAARSLDDGVSYSLQNVLTSLRRKNVELSNQLFDLALARFRNGPADPSEAEVLGGYLFTSGMTFSSNPSGNMIMVMNPADFNQLPIAESEPQRAKSFLVAAYQALLNRPIPIETVEGKQRAQKVLVFGNGIVGRYNGYAPEFEVPARAFLAQLQREILPVEEGSAGAAKSNSGSEVTTKRRTVEEILEARLVELEESADKETNPLRKMQAYVKAALAPKSQDYHRAKRIAEKIADENLRADVISFVLYRAALSFVTRNQIETAAEIEPQISDRLRRAVVRIAIAQRLMMSGARVKVDPAQLTPEQQRVFDLLSEVERDLKKEEPSVKVAKILLARTALLAKIDPAQSFVSLEQAVEMINRLETFDPKAGAAPELGLAASEVSAATVDTPRVGFNFRSAIEPRIKTDFEQIASVVERFKAKPVRGAARVETAKLYLQMQ